MGDGVSSEALAQEDRDVWHVYFLELANGDIHVGSTNDLRRRFESHQSGQVVSTKPHPPATLKSYVAVASMRPARRGIRPERSST